MEMAYNKKTKVKKGWLVVAVGLDGDEAPNGDGFRRFPIPISYLHHPLFQRLLESARETYGYKTAGPLRLPCSVEDFLHLRWVIDREQRAGGSHSTLSLHAC
ncbi:auxin-induced protein X10A-like [Phalaenopsis equestris]|uniref:auxin-induced protein X10A-like n=1 Tax=Phalaenopsis equestris TaxID=78828 RepID=UPI0009E23685|nr:auxin-induced protein X10A-like [Phalaenopsis equestris]